MALTISASVGRGGKNRSPDVRKIQRLLNAVFPSGSIANTGSCDAKTVQRIKRFQRRFMSSPDGRVDPGGGTLRRLNRAAPGLQPDWSGDSARWTEEKKLRSLSAKMRPKVKQVLKSLRLDGFKPKIYYGWRSVAVQLQLVKKGHSKVRFSFHNAQKKNGTPNAYGADIIDRRWAWGKQAKANGFWDALGRAAKAQGLFWGGNWRRFKDWAHVQYHPNSKLGAVKKESGLA